ncbi:hypothetical protein N4R57_03280 [Rhodobacteraceae bacterium D3-12]|nr:hypothetical protein N4R57_03280 [Rhodobacteraceae bacterium D3-12]
MLIALGIAFIPVAIVATGLFLSGYQPQDFSPNLRYALIGLWLLYVFTADRIADMQFWRRFPFLRSQNMGEIITVAMFAAIIASLRIDAGAPLHWMILGWLKSFVILLAVFMSLYLIFRAVTKSWRRARSRSYKRPDAKHSVSN